MKTIYDLNLEQLEEYFLSINEKKFRAKQVYEWIYQKRATSFSEMTNIAKGLQEKLQNEFTFEALKLSKKQESKDGTVKYLFELQDGELIETVLMRHDYGQSVCVTSQVGCNLGCEFCASGLQKKVRDLTPGEMMAQIMYVQHELDKEELRVSHYVVMGTGEPFDNYDNVMSFISNSNNPFGLAIGARHITVSTCGLVDKIEQFAHYGLQVNLAISLHAANDQLRNQLMPINNKWDLESLIDAVEYYIALTNRRVTFEYILLKGVNDSAKDAQQLVKLLRGINCYVNIIPFNKVDETHFMPVSKADAFAFFDILKKENIQVTIRREFGTDIDAACGQLRSKSH